MTETATPETASWHGRSEFGRGETVGIYFLNDHGDGAQVEASDGEDFAVCHSAVVVKAKAHVKRDELVTMLQTLVAELLQKSQFVEIKPEVIRCERCVTEAVAPNELVHSPLCQDRNGHLTNMTDEQVLNTLQTLAQYECHVERNPLPLGTDDVTF